MACPSIPSPLTKLERVDKDKTRHPKGEARERPTATTFGKPMFYVVYVFSIAFIGDMCVDISHSFVINVRYVVFFVRFICSSVHHIKSTCSLFMWEAGGVYHTHMLMQEGRPPVIGTRCALLEVLHRKESFTPIRAGLICKQKERHLKRKRERGRRGRETAAAWGRREELVLISYREEGSMMKSCDGTFCDSPLLSHIITQFTTKSI